MRPDDRGRLQHMADAAREAVSFAEGQTYAGLEADHMRALPLTRLIEIIGEATTAMSPEMKAAHPDLPWRVMAAMRNRLIHAYFNVDLQIVLDTAQADLPPLILALEAILDEEG